MTAGSALGYCGQRFDVPELRQECILVVIAASRQDPALFIKTTDLAERQGYTSTGRRK
jgi:hypothetical protein